MCIDDLEAELCIRSSVDTGTEPLNKSQSFVIVLPHKEALENNRSPFNVSENIVSSATNVTDHNCQLRCYSLFNTQFTLPVFDFDCSRELPREKRSLRYGNLCDSSEIFLRVGCWILHSFRPISIRHWTKKHLAR